MEEELQAFTLPDTSSGRSNNYLNFLLWNRVYQRFSSLTSTDSRSNELCNPSLLDFPSVGFLYTLVSLVYRSLARDGRLVVPLWRVLNVFPPQDPNSRLKSSSWVVRHHNRSTWRRLTVLIPLTAHLCRLGQSHGYNSSLLANSPLKAVAEGSVKNPYFIVNSTSRCEAWTVQMM